MKISIHPTLYAYLLTLTAFSSWQSCVGAMAALFIHEAAHYLMGRLFHERIDRLDLTPFGGMMSYSEGYQPKKGLCGVLVAAAGPAANYVMLLVASVYFSADSPLQKAFISANLTMMVVNLLPALPLDGGRIVFSAGYFLFRTEPLITMLTTSGFIVGAGFLLLAVYGFCTTTRLNCSMVIVGVYLILCARKSRNQLFAENLLTVLQEADELDFVRRARVYKTPPSAPLHALVGFLSGRNDCLFIFEEDGCLYSFSEKNACRAILKHPTATVSEAFSKKSGI